mmetsp:Transcript_42631/g.67466  ORF Transcript_42631/g.67466 Transcript_42631/m.67466 type:complete len:674 (-) Transcript_42631:55-2076(-)
MCAEHAHEVVSADLVSFLMRALAICSDEEVKRCVVSLLARIMHFTESDISWMVCTGRVGTTSIHSLSDLAGAVRLAYSAEMEGIKLWRTGNHLPAAAEFRAAIKAYNSVLRIGSNKELTNRVDRAFADTLARHLREVPLTAFVQACESQHNLLQNATVDARSADFVAARDDDCPICLEGAGSSPADNSIWTCGKCNKWMHTHCAAQWHERNTNATCPLCRQPMHEGQVVASAYARTKAVAEAATKNLQSSLPAISLRGEVHSAAFLALSVASLWRAALQIGTSVGVPPLEIQECEMNMERLEANADVYRALVKNLQAFETNFVQVCEQRALEQQGDKRRIDKILELVQTMSQEILQRQCAMLGEEAAIWETEVTRLERNNRYSHAEQLLSVFSGHLSDIIQLAHKGGLRCAGVQQRLEEAKHHREALRTLRDARNTEDSGSYSAIHRERKPLLYLNGCFGRPWDRSALHRHGIICMRSILAATRTCAAMIENSSRSDAHTTALVGARRLVEEAGHVIHAMLQDRLPAQVASYLGSDRNRCDRLLAIAFFEELQHCGEEARASTFTHLDAMLTALAHPRNATDNELQDCICSLIHSIIFSGGCEARMAARLQRESSPRTATTLEEWFLDTLLVQSNACTFREQILQPSQADAWLCCGGQDARSAGLEAFFSVEG